MDVLRVPLAKTAEGPQRIPLIHTAHNHEREWEVPLGYFHSMGGNGPQDMTPARRQMLRQRKFIEGVSKQDVGPLEQYWTADEMLSAAKLAEQQTQKAIHAAAPQGLHNLEPVARQEAWNGIQKEPVQPSRPI